MSEYAVGQPGMEPELIECKECHQELPESAYYDAKHHTRCRECTKARHRDWYQAHREQSYASNRARLDRIAAGEPSSIRYKRAEPE
jgi:recombinational DNA repair protein (RecF pathway)